jgi:hypothetical protein
LGRQRLLQACQSSENHFKYFNFVADNKPALSIAVRAEFPQLQACKFTEIQVVILTFVVANGQDLCRLLLSLKLGKVTIFSIRFIRIYKGKINDQLQACA